MKHALTQMLYRFAAIYETLSRRVLFGQKFLCDIVPLIILGAVFSASNCHFLFRTSIRTTVDTSALKRYKYRGQAQIGTEIKGVHGHGGGPPVTISRRSKSSTVPVT